MNEWDEDSALADADADAHHCELCGTPVELVASREGTTSYRPLPDQTAARRIEEALTHYRIGREASTLFNGGPAVVDWQYVCEQMAAALKARVGPAASAMPEAAAAPSGRDTTPDAPTGAWAAMRGLLRAIASVTSAVENHRCPVCRTTHIDPDLLAAVHRVAELGERWADGLPSPNANPMDAAGEVEQ